MEYIEEWSEQMDNSKKVLADLSDELKIAIIGKKFLGLVSKPSGNVDPLQECKVLQYSPSRKFVKLSFTGSIAYRQDVNTGEDIGHGEWMRTSNIYIIEYL